MKYKQFGWGVAAFYMGCIGAVFGNMVGYIEPIEVAFPAPTFGIFMVAMALLGGKGTLWGPVLGAVLVPCYQRNYLDLSARVAVGGSWSDSDCKHRLLSAGYYGLVANQIS